MFQRFLCFNSKTQNNYQSPSVWAFMQDLTSWSLMIMRTVRNHPRTTREDLVSDLKATGTIVTKKTIDNILRREGLKSCNVPLLKKAHVQARLKFAIDLEENWVKVLLSDESKIHLFGINSTRRVWRRSNAAYDPNNTIHTIQSCIGFKINRLL